METLWPYGKLHKLKFNAYTSFIFFLNFFFWWNKINWVCCFLKTQIMLMFCVLISLTLNMFKVLIDKDWRRKIKESRWHEDIRWNMRWILDFENISISTWLWTLVPANKDKKTRFKICTPIHFQYFYNILTINCK